MAEGAFSDIPTMLPLYVLNDSRDPVQWVGSPADWEQHFVTTSTARCVGIAQAQMGHSPVQLVTSFVGCFEILFETLLFTADGPTVLGRYRTWRDAEAGHKRALAATFG